MLAMVAGKHLGWAGGGSTGSAQQMGTNPEMSQHTRLSGRNADEP